jgi:Tfp pilus assembly protein PilF
MKIKSVLIAMFCIQLAFCASSQNKIEKSREQDPRYQYNMGLSYLNSSQMDLAVKHLKRSLSLDPDNYLALNALGLAYSIQGKFQESMKYFKDCLKINPALSEAHNNLGFVYNELGLYEQAEQEFLTATLDTQYSSRELPFYNLARLYLIQNRIEDALFQVQKSLEIKEDYLLALNLEGQILMKLDQIDKAIQSFEKARKNNPDDIDLNFNLAEAYFKKGQFQSAKKLFDSIYMRTTDPELKKRIESYLRQIK